MNVPYALNYDKSVVTGAQIFYEILDSFSVRDVTGYSGGNVLPLIDAFANPPESYYGELKPIAVHMHANEACAAHAATGIARSSNHIGVCIVTSGPGITNCVTPIRDAYSDGAALLVISGQVARTAMGKEAFQEVDAVGVTTPVTKWSSLVNTIEGLPWAISRAIKMMLNERPGPVHLDVPKDILTAPLPLEFDPFMNRRLNRPSHSMNPVGCEFSRSYVDLALGKKITNERGGVIAEAAMKRAGSGRLLESPPRKASFGISTQGEPGKRADITNPASTDDAVPHTVMFHREESTKDLLQHILEAGVSPTRPIHHPTVGGSNVLKNATSSRTLIDKNNPHVGCGPDLDLNIPKLIRLITCAKKPLIHVGNGARSASIVLRALSHHLGIPTTCTMHGLGVISHDDSLFLHWIGMHGSVYANKAIMEADLIISFGARFDDRSIGSAETFGQKAREAALAMRGGIVHIDLSPDAFGKSGVVPHLCIRADCGVVASELLSRCEPATHTDWVEHCQAMKKKFMLKLPESVNGEIHGPHIIDAVDRWFTKTGTHEEAIVTTGVGNHQMYAAQYFSYKTPFSLVSSGGLGTMGVGLPFAIGCAIAHPDDHIVNFDGDGSFNMSYCDLSTLMRYKHARVKIFIFNDAELSMVSMWQQFFLEGRKFITDNVNPDYCRLATAHSIKTVLIDSLDTMDERVDEAMMAEEPVIVNCKVVSGHVFPMAIPGTSLADQYHSFEHMLECGGSAGPNISPG